MLMRRNQTNEALAALDKIAAASPSACNSLGELCKKAGIDDADAEFFGKFAREFEQAITLSAEDLIKRALRRFTKERDADAILRGIAKVTDDDGVKCAAVCQLIGPQDLRELPEDAAVLASLEKRAQRFRAAGRTVGRLGKAFGKVVRMGTPSTRVAGGPGRAALRPGVGVQAGPLSTSGVGDIGGGRKGPLQLGAGSRGRVGSVPGAVPDRLRSFLGGGAAGAGAGIGTMYGLGALNRTYGPGFADRRFLEKHGPMLAQNFARSGNVLPIIRMMKEMGGEVSPQMLDILERALMYRNNPWI